MNNILDKKEVVNSTYEVKFFIGRDNFHEKYRVKGEDGRTYLLKLYNSSKLTKNDISNGNLLEVEILASLNLENTVRLVNNGEFIKENNKYHYIILDFISGETIQDKLGRDGVFSQYSAIPIIIYLLETLQEIHKKSNPIIHNNINSRSIQLDYSNAEKPILTEFSSARYITSKSNSLDLDRLSPFYMAPELYNGVFTPQSDIFSVGALLYNMIIGIPPWYIEIPSFQHTQEKFIDAINDARKQELNFGLKEFDEFKDDHFKKVIKKALAVSIDNRFKNVDEFISALKGETVLSNDDNKDSSLTKKAKTKKGTGFSAIAGMQDLKDILYNDVIRALNEKELYERYGITIPNGMLLYGPPGCGKTFISERFAEEVGFNFLQLKPSDIKSQFINATEEKIGAIFKEAIEKAPTIIFIDEIDAVVPNREGNLHQMQAGPVNEFLAQMSNCSEKGIFVIAASNRPEKIDPAIIRTGRIDRIVYLPPPDFNARATMFKLYLKKRPIDLGLNYERLAELTKNYVSSDIKFLVDEASRMALNQKCRITQEIFEGVISNNRPSVSQTELLKYEKLREKLEDIKTDKSETNQRKPIGFKRKNNK
ncbi:AAA family ATPase [Lentimicrobium sp. S6]|uniref:AAA family ATPase n=1 Tax=Lentimicrobium sp. S6 TaxID=2735872 RepID=UPI001553AF57|nr:AAA family ATPase [Lentimicrobium sp. S6]NPD47245.1 AAA family ATPase [Lentimicrobium sp. S6]